MGRSIGGVRRTGIRTAVLAVARDECHIAGYEDGVAAQWSGAGRSRNSGGQSTGTIRDLRRQRQAGSSSQAHHTKEAEL